MPSPAPRSLEDDDAFVEEEGWPTRQEVRPPLRWEPPRRRRALRVPPVLLLALLGLALAAAAGIWYVSLARSSPPSELRVPRVTGLREHAAVLRLTRDGFAVRAVERAADAPAGRVYSQRPAATATLARGASVTIDVSNGQTP